MPSKKNEPLQIASIAFTVLAFIGGMAVNAFTIAEKIATKQYVDVGLAETRKYTDEKLVSQDREHLARVEAIKQGMLLELEKYNTTLKGIEVKLDMVQTSLSTTYKKGR